MVSQSLCRCSMASQVLILLITSQMTWGFSPPLTRPPTSSSSSSSSSPVRTLLIDNYDSYTYNLAHYLAEVNGVSPLVVYNDECGGDWKQLHRRYGPFDNIVISPGRVRKRESHTYIRKAPGVGRGILVSCVWDVGEMIVNRLACVIL